MQTMSETIELVQSFFSKRNMEISGHSDEEIENFKKQVGKKLPDIYLEYLSKLGKVNPGLNNSICSSIEEISKIKENLNKVRLNYTKSEFPIYNEEEMFVFMNDDGWRIFFFYFNDSENPQIFTYDRSEKVMEIQSLNISFTDFVKEEVENTIKTMLWLEKVKK
jgi:SMI1-KNR4 cell-wall